MSNYLLTASPIYGHVAPMVTIGRHLVAQGHRVRMLTGSRFASAVADAGIVHIPLPPDADYDDRDPNAFEGRAELTGVRGLVFDVEHNFVGMIAPQYRAVRAELDREGADAVLSETAFLGVTPLLLGDERPPVFVCGVVPLTVSSRDTAPFGLGLAPSRSVPGRLRNRLLNLLVQRGLFRRAQRSARSTMRALGVRDLPCFVLDSPSLADGLLQLTGAGFEYPRSDLRTGIAFVGPLLPTPGAFTEPAWWPELAGNRPVVLVTQGTIANTDPGQLIVPTLRALADLDVLVVATTGDQATADAVRSIAPANARIEAFVPYDRLLDRVDLMITNGGYGGVQYALAHGVPLIVAGDTEDKPEIAARVQWSGTGINLRTGSPTERAVRDAVNQVLNNPVFRTAAEQLAAELSQSTPLETITAFLEDAVAARSGRVSATGDVRGRTVTVCGAGS